MQTTYQMQLSKTIDKKRVPLGSIPVRIFDLSEFGADLPAATSEKDGVKTSTFRHLGFVEGGAGK